MQLSSMFIQHDNTVRHRSFTLTESRADNKNDANIILLCRLTDKAVILNCTAAKKALPRQVVNIWRFGAHRRSLPPPLVASFRRLSSPLVASFRCLSSPLASLRRLSSPLVAARRRSPPPRARERSFGPHPATIGVLSAKRTYFTAAVIFPNRTKRATKCMSFESRNLTLSVLFVGVSRGQPVLDLVTFAYSQIKYFVSRSTVALLS